MTSAISVKFNAAFVISRFVVTFVEKNCVFNFEPKWNACCINSPLAYIVSITVTGLKEPCQTYHCDSPDGRLYLDDQLND